MKTKLLIALILLLVVPACTERGGSTAHKQYLAELEATRAAGLPTTASELQIPAIQAEQDAAPLYRELAELLKSKPLAKGEVDAVIKLFGWRTIPNQDLQFGREVLHRRTDISKLVNQLSTRSGCDLKYDYSKGPELVMPEMAIMRTAARWLEGESGLLMRDGKYLEAANRAALGFRIARHAARQPLLIAYLVSAAVDAITLRSLEAILYASKGAPDVAIAVQRAIDKEWRPDGLAYAMQSEAIMYTVVMDRFRKDGPSYAKKLAESVGRDDLTLPSVKDWPDFADNNHATLMRVFRNVSAAIDMPYPQARDSIAKATSELESGKPEAFVAKTLVPVYGQAASKRTQIAAKIRVVRTATVLLMRKARRGQFPSDLLELGNRPPLDPFDLKPLKYRKQGNGFVLYSVGESGKFDGKAKDTKEYNLNAVFAWPLPAMLKVPVAQQTSAPRE